MATTTSDPRPVAGTAVRIRVHGDVLPAALRDNAASRSLLDQLPLSVTLADYAGQEKVAELPRPLSTAGMPPGDSAEPLDIGYYAPGDVLVLYYARVGYFRGITRIGTIDSSVEALRAIPDGSVATIEVAD